MALKSAPALGAEACFLIMAVLQVSFSESHLLNDQSLEFSSSPRESNSEVGRLMLYYYYYYCYKLVIVFRSEMVLSNIL